MTFSEILSATYVYVPEADDYFNTVLGTAQWDLSSEEDKEKALKMATRAIDRLSFKGSKTDETQVLEFPRDGETQVPAAIKIACCEEAFCLISGDNPNDNFNSLRVSSEGVVTVNVTYDRDNQPIWVQCGLTSPKAYTQISQYIDFPKSLKLTRS